MMQQRPGCLKRRPPSSYLYRMRIISRTIWILSFVSLFADFASEMVYPVVPLYLKEIGFGFFYIGLLEGLANFTAGISKGYFGKLSDVKMTRLPFVKWGYLLGAIAKPMMVLFTFPLWVFAARTVDRLGKGLRSAARDAIIANEATPQTKARVFSFHRGWDTVGAVLGAATALLFLQYAPGSYTTLFYIAFIPGIIAVLLLFVLKEKQKTPTGTTGAGGFFSFIHYRKTASPAYKKLVTALLLFALFNSSDMLLLLLVKQITQSDLHTILVYIFYNLVFAAASYPMGILADQLGLKKIFLLGLVLFAVVYGCMALQPQLPLLYLLFFIYGLYAAATEGVSKAWISGLAAPSHKATAIGYYTALQSVAALVASSVAGLVWNSFGAAYAFALAATGTVVVIIYMSVAVRAKD
jgi:MFS family permease